MGMCRVELEMHLGMIRRHKLAGTPEGAGGTLRCGHVMLELVRQRDD